MFPVVVVVSFLAAGQPDVERHQWPQWGGASRNFEAPSTDLADSWPPEGPRRLWKRALGDGYSGMAIVGKRLYTMYRKDDLEFVVALDAETGEPHWEHSYATPFLPGTDLGYGEGPLATPLVVGEQVCAVGVTGIFHCFDAKTGHVQWSHRLFEEFDGSILFRGYSSSPVAYRGTVIATVGGTGHAVVAFRLEDGAVAWKKQDFQISHSSPIVIQFGGKDQLIVFASEVIAGLDPATGDLLWKHAQPISGGEIASMPVWDGGNRLVFSCAYEGGSRCLELARDGVKTSARELWYNNKMRVHHSNVIRVDDFIVGPSGDFGPKTFRAVDLKTGEIVWQTRDLARASSVYADGKLIALEEDGQLSLSTVARSGLKVHSKVALFEGRAWTPPSLVGKSLYVRNREDIMAFELP